MSEQTCLSSQEVKKELTRMLAEADRFFREQGLSYTIFSGTLLGSVRHGGFIPWDDDLDLAMLRPEYEKLLALLRKENRIGETLSAEGFELGNGELPYIKLIDKNICVEESVSDYCHSQDYLWIDIFPIDGIPAGENRRKNYFRHQDRLNRLYLSRRILYHHWMIEGPKVQKSFKSKLYDAFVSCLPFRWLTRRTISHGSKYDIASSDLITNTLWGIGFREAFPPALFRETEEVSFEDIRVMAMTGRKEWLAIRYGDYMKLPPEQDRYNHSLKAWRSAT